MSRKVCRMVLAVNTAQAMTTLCKGQILFWRKHGFEVDVLTPNDNPKAVQAIIDAGAKFFDMNYVRDMSPYADIKTTFRMIKLFIARKPDVIQLMTLKPSILGGIAGRITGVPVIIRHKWGNMRDCNYRRLNRFLLFSADKLSNMLADQVVAICHKLKDSELQAGAVAEKKVIVHGSGSCNGLDLDRFKRTEERIELGRKIRENLGIGQDVPVLGTVMRINTEKGVCELIDAFLSLSEKYSNLRLIIVGDYDIRNKPPQFYVETIANHPGIHHVGFQERVEEYYAAMNIFIMPSYREGFCESNIEASGMGLPVVTTNIIGCSESVKDNVSGLLVPPRNKQALAAGIEKLLIDTELAAKLGKQGRARAEAEFDQRFVLHSQLRNVCRLLDSKGIKPPIELDTIEEKSCPLCK